MCGHPGFFEWLLKHIIKAHFGDVVVKDVMVYEKQGVFYKPYQAKVEVASAHQ